MVYPNFRISHWNKQEIQEDYLESTNPVLEHDVPTVSEVEGMKIPLTIHESIDKWTAEGNQEREAPYGLVSKQDMINAILDGDLETIDSSLIGANVALYAIDQDEELSKEMGKNTISMDSYYDEQINYIQKRKAYVTSAELCNLLKKVLAIKETGCSECVL